MAVNSVNTTSTGSLLGGQRRGLSGLASGMDTDEIVKGMTIGTRTKIAKQKQNKQTLTWQGEAMRNITDKLYSLSKNYTSFTSSTNLLSQRFFERTDIRPNGANANKVSVTGIGTDQVEITRIKQLSVDASTTTGAVSASSILSKEIDLNASVEVSNLEGKSINIKYGGKEHTILMESGKDYSTPEKIAESLNAVMKDVRISATTSLADKIKFDVDNSGGTNKLKLSYQSINDGNSVEIKGGDSEALKSLGIQVGDKLTAGNTSIVGTEMKDYNTTKTAADIIGGTAMTFNLNGILKTIKLPTSGELKEPTYTIDKLAKQIQTSLDTVYGAGRIKVGTGLGSGGQANKLEFYTTDPKKPIAGGFDKDHTSTLKIVDADKGVLNTLGISKGANNRINLDASIKEAGFAGLDLTNAEKDAEGNLTLEINGAKIKGIKEDTTVRELMDKINSSDEANVKISYLEMADKFVISSKINGASGKVEIKDDLDNGKQNLASMLFGKTSTRTSVQGQDAELSLRYKGTNEEISISRSANNFSLEGMNINLKGTFGYSSAGTVDNNTEAITFSASADSKKIIDNVKKMVDSYNEIVDLVHKELTTKKDRGFAPLTDEQRKEMSEKEIENWEKKAKQGLLFNNPELRSLSSELQFIFGLGADSIGISVSSNFADHGKLKIDESKLKEAIDSNPEKVRDFFAKDPSSGKAGVMHKMKSTLDKYAKASGSDRGILVNRAGTNFSPLSMSDNAFSKQMSSIDKMIAQLEGRLKMEENRYYKQFTNLEKLVSKMNAQSGYLMQQFGQ
ncbi:MAG: flagellar filament capping protein FliD [Peptostreptococcaceae bacterium]|nr:flagellar filament capping protein FliD [Peptostreptococcaceae bacterium]